MLTTAETTQTSPARALRVGVIAFLTALACAAAPAAVAAPPAGRAAPASHVVAQAAAAPLNAAAALTPAEIRRNQARTMVSGLGAWVDLYDWAPTTGYPTVTATTIDTIASLGSQTLYLQSGRPGGPLLQTPARLAVLIARARSHGMRVVLWYLPTTVDMADDLAHLQAAAALTGVDGIAVDAESAKVTPVSERTTRLVSLMQQIHAATTKPVAVIVPSPTALALWSPTYWPGYPFAALKPYSDAYLTMTYWQWHTTQTTAAGQVTTDVTRLRTFLADPGMPIHVIGSPTNPTDIRAFAATALALRITGGSVYDVRTSPGYLWPALRLLRALPYTPSPAAIRRSQARVTFSGLGAWADLRDWAPLPGSRPSFTTATIDVIAAAGAQTLYLESGRPGGPLLESPTLLNALITRARARGMRVVLWYRPTSFIGADVAHLRAAAALTGVDAIGVEAESARVTPVSERNRRLVELARNTRASTSKPVAMIVPSPTALALWTSRTYWPGYPYAALKPYGDAYVTMTPWAAYRTRTTAAGLVTTDVTRLLAFLRDSGMPIHVVGSPTTAADIRAFARVATSLRINGGSVYDVMTTRGYLWPALRLLRR